MSWSLLWIVPVLLVLVIVHELGHFATARFFGVKVKEFAFGFPPRLFSCEVGGTAYSFNAIPLGGYVRLEGEDGDIRSPDSFAAKPKRQRAVILAAGAAMNLLLAPLLFGAAAVLGEPTMQGITIQLVQPGSPAATAHMATGDVVRAIDGTPITSDLTVTHELALHPGQPVALLIWPGGNRAAARSATVTPLTNPAPGHGKIGIAFVPRMVAVSHPWWQAPELGVRLTIRYTGALAQGIAQMFHSQTPVLDQVGGPIAIAQATGAAAERGPGYLLTVAGFLTLNLAIVNLLPFPALDGGRLAMVLIEGIRGRRLDPRLEGTVHMVGFALLLMFMLIVSIHDVTAR